MPTTQATAYNAAFVPYLDPPAHPAAVCLVDSGVDVTPDTPADSPDGPIVSRLSLDGGPGTAADHTWEGLHGTRMALVGAAPINGWGAVGFWPGARIVSIRAMPEGGTGFPFDYYSKAIDLCNKQPDVVAVNLSLGCDCTPSADEHALLTDRIVAAHNNGESVVAAAGNSSGAVGSPANELGVFAVAAGDMANELCSFSNRGPGVDLVAPGCDVDLADPSAGQLWSGYPSGTSGASMTTSIALALVRSYRPDLTWEGAEHLLTTSAQSSQAGPALDVESLFRSAGLGVLVDGAEARVPVRPPASSSGDQLVTTSPASVPGRAPVAPDGNRSIGLDAGTITKGRFASPRPDRILRMSGRLTVVVNNRPRGARLMLALQRRRSEFAYTTVALAVGSTDTLAIRVPRRWRGGRLVLRYELPKYPYTTSPSVYRAVRR